MNKHYFISVIWGYSRNMYSFAPEENYHLQVLKVAKSLGYRPVALIRQAAGDIQADPNFDREILVWDYRNIFYFIWQLLKFRRAVFYVNSYEWQSFLVPFICPRTIFMGHTHPMRQTKLKQGIQSVVFNFFTRIRLNNFEEKKYLTEAGCGENKLFVVPLAVSAKYFYKIAAAARKDIVYFGNVTAKKNLSTILRALALVRKRKPEIKLHMAGKILDENFWPEVQRLGLKDSVVVYGFLPLADLASILNRFAVYANSSSDEGQCVAVYDAAMCGCALCLPEIMSFRGVYKDKALFHQPLDAEKLTENLLKYLDNPGLAADDNKKCREMILKNCSREAVEQGLKQLITGI